MRSDAEVREALYDILLLAIVHDYANSLEPLTVSLPGGERLPGEDARSAALRGAANETGGSFDAQNVFDEVSRENSTVSVFVSSLIGGENRAGLERRWSSGDLDTSSPEGIQGFTLTDIELTTQHALLACFSSPGEDPPPWRGTFELRYIRFEARLGRERNG